MRKKEQIKKLKNQIEEQRKTFENTTEVLQALVEGGDVDVHFYKAKPAAYFVHKGSETKYSLCTEEIFKGLLARGVLTFKKETVLEDFVSHEYVLRLPKQNNKEQGYERARNT